MPKMIAINDCENWLKYSHNYSLILNALFFLQIFQILFLLIHKYPSYSVFVIRTITTTTKKNPLQNTSKPTQYAESSSSRREIISYKSKKLSKSINAPNDRKFQKRLFPLHHFMCKKLLTSNSEQQRKSGKSKSRISQATLKL